MLSTIIKKTPIPIAGLMLALASIGNLVVRHGILYKNIFGICSSIILLLLLLKLIAYPKEVLNELKNPIALSVIPTFSMGLMVLATYFKPYAAQIAYGLWVIAIVLHVILMLVFVKRYIFDFNINKVFASYFIVFVGVVVASVTAPAFNMIELGQYIFYFGLASYFILLPVVLYRTYIIKGIPEPAKPIAAILAAPASLCLAGYLSSFVNKNITLVYILLTLSIGFALWIIINTPKLLKSQFFASYSAFTFPFAITAIGLRKSTVFVTKANLGINWLGYVAQFAEIWALLIIAYVSIRYCMFYFNLKKQATISG